jgi:hypothetical protein
MKKIIGLLFTIISCQALAMEQSEQSLRQKISRLFQIQNILSDAQIYRMKNLDLTNSAQHEAFQQAYELYQNMPQEIKERLFITQHPASLVNSMTDTIVAPTTPTEGFKLKSNILLDDISSLRAAVSYETEKIHKEHKEIYKSVYQENPTDLYDQAFPLLKKSTPPSSNEQQPTHPVKPLFSVTTERALNEAAIAAGVIAVATTAFMAVSHKIPVLKTIFKKRWVKVATVITASLGAGALAYWYDKKYDSVS